MRLTGGEPLVRREFPALVARLAAIEGIEDLSLTTNGYLLAEQAQALVAAGIDRVNVSIDSLARARFFEVTRRDALDRVLAGLDAIAAFPEVRPVKVNAVPIPGFGEDDVRRFVALAREHRFQVRFIEFMPLDGDRAWRAEDVLTGAEVRGDGRGDRGRAARAPARAARDRARLRVRRRAAARSASSTRSPNRSAATATGCG